MGLTNSEAEEAFERARTPNSALVLPNTAFETEGSTQKFEIKAELAINNPPMSFTATNGKVYHLAELPESAIETILKQWKKVMITRRKQEIERLAKLNNENMMKPTPRLGSPSFGFKTRGA